MLLLLLVLALVLGGHGEGGGGGEQGAWRHTNDTLARASAVQEAPSFLEGQPGQTTAAAGSTARLHCAVQHLADRAVSWVRVRDLVILAHGGLVFSSDARVAAASVPGPGDVTRHELSISEARATDAGRYECQLNTDPKMSLFVNLTVYEGSEERRRRVTVLVAGAEERRAAPGESLTLECEARDDTPLGSSNNDELSLDIRWLHEDWPLNPQTGGGVWLESQRWARRALSRLTVSRLAEADAGRYTCAAGDGEAHVRLVVSDAGDDGDHDYGERSEAMQRDQEPSSPGHAPRLPPAPRLALALTALLALTVRGPGA